MRVDAYAGQPHYVAHLAAVWFSLPPDQRGRFYAHGLAADLGNGQGIAEWRVGHPPRAAGLPCLVAGYADEANLHRPVIYLEHGAGQAYPGDPAAAEHPAYSGTPGHDQAVLFLCPSARVAERWRARYPAAPAVPVGCPRMDAWHRLRPPTPLMAADRPTVAITFHANNLICSETTGARSHYEDGLPAAVARLRGDGWDVIGHGHPRQWPGIGKFWQRLGVEPVPDFDTVLARADVLAVDNSSAGPEFASLGRPIVWMNASWYRRTVNHGGRFWEWTDGIATVDGPDELVDAIETSFSFPPALREAHERMVRAVYVATDGMASERAVEAIMGLDATGV